MSLTKRFGLMAGAAALSLTGIAGAGDGDIDARIANLEAQLAQLRTQQDGDLSERRVQEIRNVINDVLADADTRATLLQGGMTGGYNNGFFLGSADGNFRLNISGLMQARFIYNFSDDSADGDRHRYGFENTRTRLFFDGHVVNPNWNYHIEADFGEEGFFNLLDAWVRYDFDNGFSLTGGQFRVPLNRESLVHARHQQLVERSLLSDFFGGGRTQGIKIGYEADNFRFAGSFNDGAGMDNTPWNTGPAGGSTEYSFSARADFLLQGNWSQFDGGFSSWQGEEMGIRLGGGLHFQDGEYGTPDGEDEVFIWTIDGDVRFGGANLFASFSGAHIDMSGGGNVDIYGLVVQGGFFIAEDMEIFGRLEWGIDDDDVFGDDDLLLLTFGVTKFFAQHNAKWTTDLGIGLNEVGAWAVVNNRAGWRPDSDDGQFVIRSQFQLQF